MSLKGKLIKIAFGKFQAAVTKFKDLLKKPKVLTALKLSAFAIMTPLLLWLKNQLEKKLTTSSISDKALFQIQNSSNITEDDVINYVKNNRNLQNLLNYVGKDLDESLLSDVIINCENPEIQTNSLITILGDKELSAEDFFTIIQNQSDLGNKIDSYKRSKELDQLLSKLNDILPWIFLVYIIILKIKEFLTQNEYPSVYRGKYIQRLIRVVSAVLKERLYSESQAAKKLKSTTKGLIQDETAQIETILNTLKTLDTLIVGSLLASFVYLQNRKILQKESLITFGEIVSVQSCIDLPKMLTDEETTPATIPYSDTPAGSITIAELLSCPVNLDENIVPHEPMEDKLQNLSCDIILNPDVSINEGSKEDLATKALFENKTTKNFNILVTAGDILDIKIPMVIYDNENIYPQINGIIDKIELNKIFVKDITDSDNTNIENNIKKFQDLYKEQNDTKLFIKDFYLPSLYPMMLKESPLIDGSLNTVDLKKILYSTGEITERWNNIIKEFKNQTKDWEKRSKQIAGKDNIQTKAEQEKTDQIQKEMEDNEKVLFNYLSFDGNKGITQARVTKPDDKEFILIEYYFSLLQSVLTYFDKNDIVNTFIKKLNDILINRYFIDKYSIEKIKDKINNYSKILSEGTYFHTLPNFYDILKVKWDQLKMKPGESFTAGEDYLKNLSKNNTKLTQEEKTTLQEYILFLFNFSLVITNLIETKFSIKITRYQETKLEGIWIEGFFNTLWKRYNDLPREIEDLTQEMDKISQFFSSYSIVNIDDEEYRWYTIDEELCEMPEEDDPYLSPKSKMKYNDKKYWLRYCAFATLASVINPTNWSTGFPPPIGPILFPTVYIPIKPFQMKWGIIVLGLTITGIYLFPWILFVNWSSQNHVPLVDPAAFIQREVDALKKEISKSIKNFKKITIKSYMDKVKIDVDNATILLISLEDEKKVHQLAKPKRNREIPPRIDIPRYTENLVTWTANGFAIDERILNAKRIKFTAEIKYKILKDSYDGAPVVPNADAKIQALENTEKNLISQFDQLDLLIEKMDDFLAPLPINTKPETANFAFTLKNPKPIIKMADNIDQTINFEVLDKIIEKFELKNEDFMNSNYGVILNKSFNNIKVYKNALKLTMPTLIQADPFPKYENLKPTNLPWMKFLLINWAPAGAKTYGFPLQPPLPS